MWGGMIDTPRFPAWSLLAVSLYVGAYTVHGWRTGVCWSRSGPILRIERRRYVRYMAGSVVLTVFALGASIYGFVTAWLAGAR